MGATGAGAPVGGGKGLGGAAAGFLAIKCGSVAPIAAPAAPAPTAVSALDDSRCPSGFLITRLLLARSTITLLCRFSKITLLGGGAI